MRYLNKIIFLNSAHIPYAEVKLDGNVHFIGTQGVGKSTLLRALLFFYNADKLKLGIPKTENHSPLRLGSNYTVGSILTHHLIDNVRIGIWKVERIKTLLLLGDASFERDWFINEHNEVYPEWGHIRERIGGKRQITSQITVYEMYRDIIFGNNRKQDMTPYRKFAIVESAKYQNIPRTIQNVFLNSKLDADFIKDTIIRSMTDEEVFVDLSFYRSQIKEFEQEYNDVMLWFTRNKNGEIPVRKIADKVINSYRDLIYSHKQIDEERAELNYAEKRALQEIPHIREKINKTETERERAIRLIDELREKYNKERDSLISGMGGIETLLKQVREKRLYYEQISIEEIIKRVAQEELQNGELARISTMKEELTRAYQDVLSKYTSLFKNLDADLSLFENNKQTQILEKRSSVAGRQEKAMAQSRSEEDKVRVASEEKLQTVEQRLAQLRGEEMQMKLRQQKAFHEEHYKKEISDCEAGIDELLRRDKELDLQIRRLQMDIGQQRNECELKRKELEMAAQRSMDVVRREKTDAEEQLRALDALIEKRKGSFCDWLEQHNPGWQETIGKVADEESVLYNHELNPRLTDDAGTLFGVSLNLSAIDRSIRTPEEMKQERAAKQVVYQDYCNRLTRLAEELSENISRLEKKYSKQIREMAGQQHLMEAERGQIPYKLKNLQADHATWKTKEEEWKRVRMEESQAGLNEIARRFYLVDEEKKKYLLEREKQLKACQKNYKDVKTELQLELDRYVDEVRQEINSHKQLIEEQKRELRQAQDDELNGKGADMATIRKYDERLAEIREELKYISEHRNQVAYYEKDKQELFDKEPAMRSRKKEYEAKLSALDERFALRREKLQNGLKEINSALEKLKLELQILESGLTEADAFLNDETFCPVGAMEVGEKSTRKTCDTLVKELKSLIVSFIRKTEDFKKADAIQRLFFCEEYISFPHGTD